MLQRKGRGGQLVVWNTLRMKGLLTTAVTMSSDVHPTRTAERGTYGRWRVARVQGYGIVAAAAACMPACSEGITAVIAPLGTVNQVI